MTFWPVSARLAATLTRTHTVVAKAEILYDGAVVRTVDALLDAAVTVRSRLQILDGSVSVARATVRRSGSVTFLDAGHEISQDDAGELLAPLRGEVRLYRGAVYADATAAEKASPPADREYVPLATLVVTRPYSGTWPQVTVEGKDRMWLVSRQRFTALWKVAPNVPVAQAIIDLLSAKLPPSRTSLDIPDTGALTGAATSLVYDEQSDPAEAVANLAVTAGQVVYADPMGTIVARTESDPDPADAVLILEPGPNSVMLRPARERDVSDVENAVVAVGESPDLTVPAWGYAEDSDPASLTYAAAVGVIPRFFSSPLLTTNTAAVAAARTILRTQLGLADTVAQGMVANPALDAGDVLVISDPGQGLSTTVTADSFTVPLTGATMDLSCRTRTVPL